MKRVGLTVFQLCVVIALFSGAVLAEEPATKSLYDRLGGAYPISVVVDDFIERLLVNDTRIQRFMMRVREFPSKD